MAKSRLEDPKEIQKCPKCKSTNFLVRWHVGDWLLECADCGERKWLEEFKPVEKKEDE